MSWHVLPSPGDIVVATRSMRAWENDNERGVSGDSVMVADMGLLVQAWRVDNQFRMRLLIEGKLLLFSHPLHVVAVNWQFGDRIDRCLL